MRTTRIQLAVAVLCGLLTFAAPSAFAQASSDDQIVEQARKSYYNLHDQGLKGFRCNVRVDWDAAFAAMKADTIGREQVLPMMRQTHFEVVVGPAGASEVSHHFDGTPPDEQAAQRVRTAIGGVEQMLTGFFQQWSTFLFGPPLPADNEKYGLQKLGQHFRITSGNEPIRVVETLNSNYAIEEMIITSQKATVTVRPQFQRGEKGYVPVVLDTTMEAAGADKVGVHFDTAYQDIEGFVLPQTVTVQNKLPAGDIQVLFTFSNYQIMK